MKIRRKTLLLPVTLLLLLPLLALTSCAEKQEFANATTQRHEQLTVMLDYFPNANHAGIFEAQDSDRFKDAGLDVKLQTPSDPASPLKLLAAGKVDVAISYEPELLLARSKGMRLIAIGAIFQKPLNSLISLPDANINQPSDLIGKRVGTVGTLFDEAYLRTTMEDIGAEPDDVKNINVGYNLVPALLTGKVDAILGAMWSYEAIELHQRDKHPHVLRMADLNMPNYNELVFVVREEDLQTKNQQLRRFMQAVTNGYDQVRKNPHPAIDALLKANPDLKRPLQIASIEAITPILFPTDSKHPFGYQDKSEWQHFSHWMHKTGLVEEPVHGSLALTNEFLAGQSLESSN